MSYAPRKDKNKCEKVLVNIFAVYCPSIIFEHQIISKSFIMIKNGSFLDLNLNVLIEDINGILWLIVMEQFTVYLFLP